MAKQKKKGSPKNREDFKEHGVYVKSLKPRMFSLVLAHMESADQATQMAAWATYCTFRIADDEPYWMSVDECLDDDECGLQMFNEVAEAALRLNGFIDSDPVGAAAGN